LKEFRQLHGIKYAIRRHAAIAIDMVELPD
jgi:hypothetical protein